MVDDLDQDYGGYFWRGGAKIELEKEENRFTVIPDNRIAWERADNLPGVRRIKPVSRGVFKVETTDAERDIIMDVLRNKPFNAIVHHAYRPKGETGTVYYLTDKITVKFQPECPLEQQEALLEKYRLQVLKEYTHLPGTFLLRITASSGENPLKIANRIREDEGVLEAEPNLVNRFHTAYRPADPYFKNQWHLEAEKGLQLLAEASVNAPAAWDISRGKREITVALIDDGFDLEHPDLCGEGKIVAPHDFVDDDTRPFPEAGRNDYHGTPCAGVALAEMNGEGVVGVAPGCSFMPVRFPLEAASGIRPFIFGVTGNAYRVGAPWRSERQRSRHLFCGGQLQRSDKQSGNQRRIGLAGLWDRQANEDGRPDSKRVRRSPPGGYGGCVHQFEPARRLQQLGAGGERRGAQQ
jgi:hypothetical protein